MGHPRRPIRPFVTLAAVMLALPAAGAAYAQVEDDLKEGDTYFEEGKYKKAAQRYDSAIDKWPGQVSAEAYGKRAAIYIIQKEYAAGLEFMARKAELRHPGSPEVLEQKALILWLLSRRDEAIAVAEKVVAARPATYSNQGILGEYYAGREPEKAITAYQAYLGSRPSSLEQNDVLPRVRLGFAYLAAKQYKDAEAQFDLLLRKHKTQPHAEVNAKNGLCAAYTALEKHDRAITVCEQIVSVPRLIDRAGSAWYNLGKAYLAKRQSPRARKAGVEFVRMRRDAAKGYILVGDAYFQERDWGNALEFYLEAEKRARPGDESVELGIKLGSTYRRLGRPAEAIAKLEAAFQINSEDMTLAGELGSAYLASEQDKMALATVDRFITGSSFDSAPARQRATMLLIAARSLYNQGEARDARARYEAAYKLRPKDVKVRIGLVQTINLQAATLLGKGDTSRAERLLLEAMDIDRRAQLTNQNLAVLALERGQCDAAKHFLEPLAGMRNQALVYHRLRARALLCQQQPDAAAAAEHYARAEKEARDPKRQANLVLAEIYTEWAPLLMANDIDQAVDKLKLAVQLAVQTREVGEAAQRNLAIALFRRGWRNMRAGKQAAALDDFRGALQERQVLRGTEPAAFEFSLALAYLERGDATRAMRIFETLGAADGRERYLKAPYDKLGAEFFRGYAKYRSDNGKLREQAATELGRLQRKAREAFAATLSEVVGSAWVYVALDAYRNGNLKESRKALRSAEDHGGSGKLKRTIEHNLAVLSMGSRGAASQSIEIFTELAATIPEAQVNLGILYDRQGKAREAYDRWVKARQRGVRSRELVRWIDAKKRIFGF